MSYPTTKTYNVRGHEVRVRSPRRYVVVAVRPEPVGGYVAFARVEKRTDSLDTARATVRSYGWSNGAFAVVIDQETGAELYSSAGSSAWSRNEEALTRVFGEPGTVTRIPMPDARDEGFEVPPASDADGCDGCGKVAELYYEETSGLSFCESCLDDIERQTGETFRPGVTVTFERGLGAASAKAVVTDAQARSLLALLQLNTDSDPDWNLRSVVEALEHALSAEAT